jgi:hypothetical protein
LVAAAVTYVACCVDFLSWTLPIHVLYCISRQSVHSGDVFGTAELVSRQKVAKSIAKVCCDLFSVILLTWIGGLLNRRTLFLVVDFRVPRGEWGFNCAKGELMRENIGANVWRYILRFVRKTSAIFGAVQAHGTNRLTDVARFVIGFLYPLSAYRLWSLAAFGMLLLIITTVCGTRVFTPEFRVQWIAVFKFTALWVLCVQCCVEWLPNTRDVQVAASDEEQPLVGSEPHITALRIRVTSSEKCESLTWSFI